METHPSAAECKKILLQICDALSYIHRKQIIHRDLKPSNILVTYSGNNVKIIDFGLSDSDWHSIHKGLSGTRTYSSPEQLAGEKPDGRSDIYSLGVIMEKMRCIDRSIVTTCTQPHKEDRYPDSDALRSALLRKKPRPLFIASLLLFLLGLFSLLYFTTLRHSPSQEELLIDKVMQQATDDIRQAN